MGNQSRSSAVGTQPCRSPGLWWAVGPQPLRCEFLATDPQILFVVGRCFVRCPDDDVCRLRFHETGKSVLIAFRISAHVGRSPTGNPTDLPKVLSQRPPEIQRTGCCDDLTSWFPR
jgi:hypothetical protein